MRPTNLGELVSETEPALTEKPPGLEEVAPTEALDPLDAKKIYDVAMELRELGRLDEAEAAFRDLVGKHPRFIHGWRGLGLTARQQGDRAAALEHFRAAVALDPGDAWPLYDMGAELRELGRLDEAEAAFRELVGKHPRFIHGWRGLGLTARQRGDRSAALEHFRAAVALDPGSVFAQRDLAFELTESGRPEEAEAVLHSFIADNPGSALGLIAYANTIRRRATAEEIIGVLEKAVAIEPDDINAKIDLAAEYSRWWRLDEAEALYDDMLEMPATHAWALLGKGHIARRRGQRAEALGFFEAAAAETGGHQEAALSEASQELMEAGRFVEARQMLLAALSKDPGRLIWRMRLGHNERLAGEFEAAHDAFAAAVAINPDQSSAQIALAIQELYLGRSDSGLTRLQAVLAANPREVEAIEALAHFADHFDDQLTAVGLRRKIVEIDGANLAAILRLTEGLFKLGRISEAEELIQLCNDKFGPMPETFLLEASMLRNRGAGAEALRLFSEASARFPTHFALWFERVLSLISFGSYDEAEKALDARANFSAGEMALSLFLRAEIAAAQWKLDEAYALVCRGLEFNAFDTRINEVAVRISLQRADIDSAQRHLEAAVRNNSGHRLTHKGASKPSQTHLGQLLNEYRLDNDLFERLRDCMTTEDSVMRLAGLVLEAEHYTPASIAFLIALRSNNLFHPACM
jgi:tetratricopeptide (TPR) repeat protein